MTPPSASGPGATIPTRRVNPVQAQRRVARRLELLEAAIDVIRRDGPSASMDQISARAGITKPIMYRYFGDRAGLYDAVAERYCGELRERFRAMVAERKEQRALVVITIDAYLGFVERDPRIHQFLVQPQHSIRPGDRTAVASFTHVVGREIAQALRQRLSAAELDVDAAEPWGHAIAGMVQNASLWWIAHPELPRARLVEYLVGLLWAGLGGAAGMLQSPAEATEAPPAATPTRRR